jgi:hypothetical protein
MQLTMSDKNRVHSQKRGGAQDATSRAAAADLSGSPMALAALKRRWHQVQFETAPAVPKLRRSQVSFGPDPAALQGRI